MKRPLLWSCVSFALAAASLAFLLLRPYIWQAAPPGPEAPRGEASIEYTEPPEYNGPPPLIVGPPIRSSVTTVMNIKYTKEITEIESAEVVAQIEQFQQVENALKPGEPSQTYPLRTLRNAVSMSLESHDFEFGQDKDGKSGNDRFVAAGSTNPTSLAWAPTPRRSGDTILLLRLKHVSTPSVVINGQPQKAGGNDDLQLPVHVKTEFWIPRWLEDLIAGIFTAIFGTAGVASAWNAYRSSRKSQK